MCVILPAYNAQKTITLAVESILAQSLTDLELAVVGDRSAGRTRGQLAKFNDDRFSDSEAERSGACRRGSHLTLQHTTGEFGARMYSDDLSHSTRPQAQLDWSIQKKQDFVSCQVRIVNQNPSPQAWPLGN